MRNYTENSPLSKIGCLCCNFNTPTQHNFTGTNPKAPWNLWNFSAINGFIKISATWSVVGMYSNSIKPPLIFSQTQWCQTSICLEHMWKMGFSTSVIVDWLSTNRKIGGEIQTPTQSLPIFRGLSVTCRLSKSTKWLVQLVTHDVPMVTLASSSCLTLRACFSLPMLHMDVPIPQYQ